MQRKFNFGAALRMGLMSGVAIAGLASFSGAAFGQAVEQNPARILAGDQITALPGSTVDVGSLDATLFGVDLSGIVIVSDAGAVRNSVRSSGVVVNSGNVHLSDPALVSVLAPFVGQPMSQQLIGQVRDAITLYMRDRNRPLVAVIIPPQEVTTGTVQLLVVPFTVGDKRVERVDTGYENTSDAQVLDTVRIGPGDEIAADTLLADLNWLNSNPFRHVGVVFAPGEAVGTTDLVLSLSESKPWRGYAGYSNTGTKATGLNRVYAGIIAASADLGDQQISYQVTAAPTTLFSGGKFFNFGSDSAYLAHSLGYFVPLAWSHEDRHKLTVRADYVRTRAELTSPFVGVSQTWQMSADYAVAVSAGQQVIDLFGGLELKRQDTDTLFAGVSTSPAVIDIVQAVFGVRGKVAVNGSQTEFSVKGVFSPGGVTSKNSDAAFVTASGNVGDSARYAYVLANVMHHSDLPGGFGLEFALSGQLSADSLPSTEKFGIGGISSVRGYETNERSGDSGLVLQAELHLPIFSLLQNSDLADQIDVYSFVDYGFAEIKATGTTNRLFGAGLGVDFNFSDTVQASLVWGHAFRTGVATAAGSDRVHGSLTVAF